MQRLIARECLICLLRIANSNDIHLPSARDVMPVLDMEQVKLFLRPPAKRVQAYERTFAKTKPWENKGFTDSGVAEFLENGFDRREIRGKVSARSHKGPAVKF